MLAALCLSISIATTPAEANSFQHHPFLYPDVLAIQLPGAPVSTLQAPMLARNQFWHTGNRERAEENLAAVNAFLKQLTRFKTDSGLLNLPPDYWQTPWPAGLVAELGRSAPTATPDPLINAFYFQALVTMGQFAQDLEASPAPYEKAAERTRQAYVQAFGAALRGAGEGPLLSNADRALALAFDLVPPADVPAVLERLQVSGPPADPYLASFAIDAALRVSDAQLAQLWFQSDALEPWRALIETGGASVYPTPSVEPSSPVYLVADRVFGLSPARPGWSAVRQRNALAHPTAPYSLPIPGGRVTIRPHPVSGVTITAPPDVTVATEDSGITVVNAMSHARANLTEAQQHLLAGHDWTKWAGDTPVAWVSIGEQMLRVIQHDEIIYQARCATATKGIGNQMGSEQTPLGWHSVGKKLGEGAPWGQVFRARAATHEVWKPGGDTKEDLVLTRVFLLDGEEPGVNKGGNVDSRARYIYIHGTNDEARIGTPSSHGCVRMRNDDVIELFQILPEGAPVLITEN